MVGDRLLLPDLAVPADQSLLADLASARMTGGDPISVAHDVVLVTHLLSASIAMGLVGFLNYSVLMRWTRPVRSSWVAFHTSAQEFVIGAAVTAWISGNLLIWLQYDLNSTLFPGALWIKLVVVKALFLSAIYSRLRMPQALRAGTGLKLSEFPLRARLTVAYAAGLSLSCWLSAFLLGGSQTLRTAGVLPALEMVLLVTAICVGGTTTLALCVHRQFPKRRSPQSPARQTAPRSRSR